MLKRLKRQKFRQLLFKYWKLLVIPLGSTALVTLLSWSGVLQGLELKVLDGFFQLRPSEMAEWRIVIVTIDDRDIGEVGAWPIPDRDLVRALETLQRQQPKAIGLDLYRDVPVEPGHSALNAIFSNNPNLIGIEKRFGLLRVPAPPHLPRSQVAFSDILEDRDQTVRRGLMAVWGKKRPYSSLATLVAATYLNALASEGNQLGFETSNEKGKGTEDQFPVFNRTDGGYVQVDDAGYQLLINFRSGKTSFQTIPFRDVLRGRLPDGFVRDRIVLIGSIAESIKDDFITPTQYAIDVNPNRCLTSTRRTRFDNAVVALAQQLWSTLSQPEMPPSTNEPGKPRSVATGSVKSCEIGKISGTRKHHIRTPGVFVHANIVSQILSGVLDGRPSIRVLPDFMEMLWTTLWASIGMGGVWRLLQSMNRFNGQIFYIRIVLGIVFTGGGIFVIHYLLFIGMSVWLPVIAPLMGLAIAAILVANLYSGELFNFAYLDGLTQVANRRYFEQVLTRYARIKGNLSLILCDVDFFKKYNDTYGHQAGDTCLQQVATTIRCAVRQTDIVARYGGEEFVVILPRTNNEDALKVAERVVRQVRDLKLPHTRSQVSEYVTLSCGVCTVTINDELLQDISWAPSHLVARADKALYLAKNNGRNQVVTAESIRS